MNNNPTVTVGIPAYLAEKKLRKKTIKTFK
jgi:hypothetical protein